MTVQVFFRYKWFTTKLEIYLKLNIHKFKELSPFLLTSSLYKELVNKKGLYLCILLNLSSIRPK